MSQGAGTDCKVTLVTGEEIWCEVAEEESPLQEQVVVVYYRTKETTEFVAFESLSEFRKYLKMLMRFDEKVVVK